MNFPDAIKSGLNNYINFEGRATRSEFWWFVLFNFVVGIVTAILDVATGLMVLNMLASVALLAPNLAVGARRLHDIDKSGWWQLLMLIPLIGLIVLIVFFAKTGNAGANRFGPPVA